VGCPISSVLADGERSFETFLDRMPLGPFLEVRSGLQERAGTTVPMLFQVRKLGDEAGATTGFIAIGLDLRGEDRLVMEQRRRIEAQLALSSSETLYHSAIDSIGDFIQLADRALVIRFANRAMREIMRRTGFSPDLEGKHVLDAFPFLDRKVVAEYETVFATGRELVTEETSILNNMPYRTETRKIPVLESGTATGVVTIIRDVTEQTATRERIAKSEKLESLGVLAGGIAHDFNNILTGVLSNLELAALTLENPQKARHLLDEAGRAIERATDLTAQLLIFSKGGEPIRRPGSIREILEETVRFAMRGSGTRIVMKMPASCPTLEFDKGQMSRVFHNIVLNARQAMEDRGVLTVAMATAEPGPRGPGTPAAAARVVITISDSGPGIPEDALPKIFDPYFTTKKRGTGLGLTIAYSIVKKHSGTLEVRSRMGEGTTFVVSLPVAEQPGSAPEPASRPGGMPRPRRVLFMDDDRMILDVTVSLFKVLGCECVTATDGQEAVDLFASAREAGSPFDLVFLDLIVPGGLGGREALQALKRIDPGVRAVVCSGYSSDAVMARHTEFGFMARVVKPFKLDDLRAVLEKTERPRDVR
jgi:PAS domain S-box-containing protein